MTASATVVTVDTSKDNGTTAVAHTYTAYPIFTGSYDTNGLTITGWGAGYNSAGLLADADFLALFNGNISATSTAAQVAQAIEGKDYADNSAGADALAKILAKYAGGTGTVISGDDTDLAAGYWLITDSYTAGDTNDAVSKFVLKVSGSEAPIEIKPKKSAPTVVKKVQENSDVDDYDGNGETGDNWNDVADYNIGDAVPFKLYGTMPSTLNDYGSYFYMFTDTLGTQFNQPETVTVNVGNKTLVFTLTDGKYVLPTADQLEWNYDTSDESKVVKVPTTDGNCRVKWDANSYTLKVTFEDIKKYAGVDTDTVVTVQYDAVLNNTANIGLNGQENKVKLTYTNNPNVTYNPSTDTPNTPDIPDIPETPGLPDTPDIPETPSDQPEKPDTPGTPDIPTDNTPEDKVIVFTYQQNIKKVDAATGDALSAKFVLSKGSGEAKKYVKLDGNGRVTAWVASEADATLIETNASTGLYCIKGLDQGMYTLTEKVAPNGYNEIGGVVLEIDAETANGQNWNGTASAALTEIALDVSGDSHGSNDSASLSAADQETNGIVQAKITNEKGIKLPSTGGIGTTLFILGGGCAAGIGGIYLISKKRAGKDE
jgi:fimbrial isopeptide formation D2 family protein/LPXTG-motif cell wall-anchored protein